MIVSNCSVSLKSVYSIYVFVLKRNSGCNVGVVVYYITSFVSFDLSKLVKSVASTIFIHMTISIVCLCLTNNSIIFVLDGLVYRVSDYKKLSYLCWFLTNGKTSLSLGPRLYPFFVCESLVEPQISFLFHYKLGWQYYFFSSVYWTVVEVFIIIFYPEKRSR